MADQSKKSYEILFDERPPSLIEPLIFEVRSKMGRLFRNKKPPVINNQKQLLNIGCATTFYDGWVNADFFQGLRFWKKNQKNRRPDWLLDLRFSLNCSSNYWDGIFTEHTLEHLYPNEVFSLLKEIHRVLKPDCWVRIVLPDTDKYIKNYLNPIKDSRFSEWETGVEALRSLTQNWGHRSLWNAKFMMLALKEAGFSTVNEVSYNNGTDKKIIKDSPGRIWESFYIEGQKAKDI